MMNCKPVQSVAWVIGICIAIGVSSPSPATAQHSVARQWNEVLYTALSVDFDNPTVAARNQLHHAIAMWDAWASFTDTAGQYLTSEKAADSLNDYLDIDTPLPPPDMLQRILEAREEAISYASYRLLINRFSASPAAAVAEQAATDLMIQLGYDPNLTTTAGKTPAALGNRIAANIIFFGLNDGGNEIGDYDFDDAYYTPVNNPLVVADEGTSMIIDPNRWQPLALSLIIDKNGNIIPGGIQRFVAPHWGAVVPFAMTQSDRGTNGVYFDPGPPPQINGIGHDDYIAQFVENIMYSGVRDPDEGTTINLSPAVRGNVAFDSYDATGHPVNPVTNQPYPDNIVKLGDWTRCLPEYMAAGLDTGSPPGHCHAFLNDISDNIAEKRIGGVGPIVSDLEWDVKFYLATFGALHDAAIAGWGCKKEYDYLRPISGVRYLAELGQSTDDQAPRYHPNGLPLIPGLIEQITNETIMPGQRHELLFASVGEIAINVWPGQPDDPVNEFSGREWILAKNWVPYQLATFITPAFAGYVSGHSVFWRSAAEIFTEFTGSPFFPGGVKEAVCAQDTFLQFEKGPSETVTLQWATYFDAAADAGLSRVVGGKHPRADDIPGRIMGHNIGQKAWTRANQFFNGTADTDLLLDHLLGLLELQGIGFDNADYNGDGVLDVSDLIYRLRFI